MKSTHETYGQWEKRTFCDNASRRGLGVHLSSQCYDGKREFVCTVIYNDGPYGRDTMTLCRECRDNLKREKPENMDTNLSQRGVQLEKKQNESADIMETKKIL